ncbi:MAG TPA: histidine phosphatase family protein [Burkholderiales bacterium]|nr:histidine phosphatase family protein [Burkholderiales bacterium]
MTLLALLRHGETAWSAAGRIQGRTDIPLLPGSSINLAKACAGMRVVTSPLQRCVQTAALLGAPDAVREPRIIEMHWGEWEGESFSALRERLGEAMRENEARGLDFRPANGESPREVVSRIRPWLSDIARDRQPTLAVTHRGVIRAILAAAFDWDMRGKPPAKLDWSAVHLFRLDQDGAPRVERLNVK